MHHRRRGLLIHVSYKWLERRLGLTTRVSYSLSFTCEPSSQPLPPDLCCRIQPPAGRPAGSTHERRRPCARAVLRPAAVTSASTARPAPLPPAPPRHRPRLPSSSGAAARACRRFLVGKAKKIDDDISTKLKPLGTILSFCDYLLTKPNTQTRGAQNVIMILFS